jgi:hypothetical protein
MGLHIVLVCLHRFFFFVEREGKLKHTNLKLFQKNPANPSAPLQMFSPAAAIASFFKRNYFSRVCNAWIIFDANSRGFQQVDGKESELPAEVAKRMTTEAHVIKLIQLLSPTDKDRLWNQVHHKCHSRQSSCSWYACADWPG